MSDYPDMNTKSLQEAVIALTGKVESLQADNTALREALEKAEILAERTQAELNHLRPICISNNLHELRVVVSKALHNKD